MKNKWDDALEAYQNIFKSLGSFIIWGGFILIVIVSIYTQGFPEGLVGGLIVGAIVAFVGWLRLSNSDQSTAEAREKLLAYAPGHKEVFRQSKQAAYAILAVILIFLLSFVLLGSCYFYSCKNDLIRPRIIAILIGLSVIIQQLFYKERLKGKPALIALAVLAALTIFLIGKVFLIW